MNKQHGFSSVELMMVFLVTVIIAGIGGWVANIYKLATCGIAIGEWGIMEILRLVGIFLAPMGSVLGFM